MALLTLSTAHCITWWHREPCKEPLPSPAWCFLGAAVCYVSPSRGKSVGYRADVNPRKEEAVWFLVLTFSWGSKTGSCFKTEPWSGSLVPAACLSQVRPRPGRWTPQERRFSAVVLHPQCSNREAVVEKLHFSFFLWTSQHKKETSVVFPKDGFVFLLVHQVMVGLQLQSSVFPGWMQSSEQPGWAALGPEALSKTHT